MVRGAALDLAGEGMRSAADVGKAPPRLDPDVDVQAIATRGLGPAGHSEFAEYLVHDVSDPAHGGELAARHGVQVYAPFVGPLGVGFGIDPAWKHVVVLGRGVGLATLAPISQLAAENGIGVTAILSARSPEFVMAGDLFARVGEVIGVLDTDGTSAVENVERILQELIAEGRADAFYTCGSNRLTQLMKRLGKAHGIPGQIAMEQIMACGLGPCYVCVKTFEVDGEKVLRRVCIDGPVFDLQEAVGW